MVGLVYKRGRDYLRTLVNVWEMVGFLRRKIGCRFSTEPPNHGRIADYENDDPMESNARKEENQKRGKNLKEGRKKLSTHRFLNPQFSL